MNGDDHLAVDHGSHGADLALHLGRAQVDQFQGALQHVGVRVFLEGDQHVGVLDHLRCQVAVRIKFRADHHLGPDDGAHALQQVAFAVIVAIGHHRAVQAEQHHVHGQRRAQVGQQFLAQGFVGMARGRAAGLRAGHHAFAQLPAAFLAAQPGGPQWAREERHLVGMLAGREVAAVLEGREAGGHRPEGIGFGGEGGTEDTHGDELLVC